MPHAFRVGYRRLPDGSVEPVCDPPVAPYLLHLWRHACLIDLRTETFVAVGTVGTGVHVEGRMSPVDQARAVVAMAQQGTVAMGVMLAKIDEQYPLDFVAQTAVSEAGWRLSTRLGDQFVETEPTAPVDGKLAVQARVEYDGPRVRVIVTGHPRENPFADWVNDIIRERVRDAILERLLRDAGGADA